MDPWLQALAGSWLGQAMRQSLWPFPLVAAAHIASFSILVGAVCLFDLRLLGVSPQLPVAALARHLLPWAHRSFGLVALTGLALLSADPVATAANPAFRLKLILLILAGVNALIFYAGPLRHVHTWQQRMPLSAQLAGLASLILWLGILLCGRLIAYL